MHQALRFQNLAAAAILFATVLCLLTVVPRSASASTVTLSEATSTSNNNASTTLATTGNKVFFQLNLSGVTSATNTPLISVRNTGTTTMTQGADLSMWTYSTTSASSWSQGNVTFTMSWMGSSGEATTTFASVASTTFQHVAFDNVAPSISTMTVSTSDSSSTIAGIGDVVTLTFFASEGLATPSVTIDGRAANHVLGTTTPARYWTASSTIISGDLSGALTFSVTPSDPAGNASSTAQTTLTTGTNLSIYGSLPSITISGSNPDNVYAGSSNSYSDHGATATDALSGSLSVSTSGSVNELVPGAYTLTYSATDATGNSNSASRTVNVSTPASNGPIVGSGASIMGTPIIPNFSGTTPTVLANTSGGNAAAIAALQTQLSALLAQISAMGGAVSTGMSSFSRDLTIGSIGADVKALQVWLNGHGFPVASSGPGSPGNETMRFGAHTQAALGKWQASVGISPASGHFGPKTRAYLSAHQ